MKKIFRSYKIKLSVPLLVVAVFTFTVLAWFIFWSSPNNHIVTLRNDGFYPSELTIKLGDTVTFISKNGESFWPASNIHPTHEIYSDFDPKEPIGSDNSWSFTFTKEGRWSYHDHIHANYTGKIIVTVLGSSDKWSAIQTASACIGEDMSQKQQCWDEQLETTLADRGLADAFDLFIELYKTEPSIAKGCHGWGHVLGGGAYKLFVNKKDFNIPNEASYCGYGFYHGFLEELLRNTGDPKGAIAFCEYARERADTRHAGSVYSNCIHGIGHGSTSMAAENPANWGNVEVVLAGGKKNCQLITDRPEELQACWEGVFNEFQQNINFAKNGFSYDIINDDFFGICRKEEEKYKKACYFEFIGLIGQFVGRDFRKAAAMVLKDVTNPQDASYMMVKLAADFMQDDIVNPTYDKNVLDCRLLPAHLRQACFDGVLLGFTAHGEPGQEYVKGLSFCRASILTNAERDRCYQSLLGNFSSSYSSEKMSDICSSVEESYKKYCQ